jgi:hypothetical protein
MTRHCQTVPIDQAAVALGVSVLVDLDHLYDFYNWYFRRKRDRLHILFHEWGARSQSFSFSG